MSIEGYPPKLSLPGGGPVRPNPVASHRGRFSRKRTSDRLSFRRKASGVRKLGRPVDLLPRLTIAAPRFRGHAPRDRSAPKHRGFGRGREHGAFASDPELHLVRPVDEFTRVRATEGDLQPPFVQIKRENCAILFVAHALGSIVVADRAALRFTNILKPINQAVEAVFHAIELDDRAVELPIEQLVDHVTMLLPALAKLEAVPNDLLGGFVGVLA